MAKIANVASSDTFNTWRVRSNESFDRLSQFAINNSSLYANTITANVSLIIGGSITANGSTGSNNKALMSNGSAVYWGTVTTDIGANTAYTTTSAIATSGQTTFSVTYDLGGFVQVFLNGVKLIENTDFTATDGSTVVLTEGATLNDQLEFVAINTFFTANVAQAYTRSTATASAGQTSFNITSGYEVGFIDTYLNGVKLIAGSDYTATDTSTVVLASGAANNDILEFVAYSVYNVANAVTPATFNSALANTNTWIYTVDTRERSALANTNSYISTKTNTSTFNSALANTNSYIASVSSTERSALANTNSYIATKANTASPTFTGDVTLGGALVETTYTLSGTALDPANGTMQTSTLSGNITFTDSFSAGESMILLLNGGSTYTVTWPTMTWTSSSGNAAPTLTANDTIILWKIGSTLYGAYAGSYT